MDSRILAKKVRINALTMVHKGGSSHIGAALSCIDILAVLYQDIMNYRSNDETYPERDRFILSKGHAGVAVYATLAEVGFFPKEQLQHHYQNGSHFSGHVSHINVPGVELSTGSLGHGLPVGVGMALASKIDNQHVRVFVLIGDGELMEGSNWEALLFAAHHNLNNLTVIIDRNNLQSLDTTENTVALNSIKNKIAAFNCAVSEIDGHCHEALKVALTEQEIKQPKVIIANTIKGKGVSYMENKVAWHYKCPNKEQLTEAIKEINQTL